MFKKLFFALALGGASAANAQDRMAELENRISELEAAQSLNIFKFSGQLETMYDSIDAKQTDPGAAAGAKTYDTQTDYLRLKFLLGMDAAISPKINFYSRMTTTKFFNTYDAQTNGAGASPVLNTQLTDIRGEQGGQVFLEKAYADYKFTEGMVFSFGRLPTEDGPPYHIPEGRPRSGTYPSLIYNTPLDGLAFSYNRAVGEGTIAARIIYTPFSSYTESTGKLLQGANYVIKPTAGGQNISTKTELTSLMFEYSNKMMNLIYQGYQTGDFFVGGEDLNAGGGAGTGKIGFQIQAHSLTAEMDRIADTGLTVAATVLMSEVKNDGTVSVPGLGSIYGLGADEEGEKLSDTTTLVSARYSLNNKTGLGAEYLMGGKNVFIYDTSSDNLTSFYATTGTGIHAYVTHKFEPELTWRIGYTAQDYEKTPFTFGASSDTDRKISTIYTKLRLDF